MNTFCTLALALLCATATLAQDSNAVKKPSSQSQENMPTRRGRGTAKPMPSPRYKRSTTPRDTVIKGFNKRDTVK